MLTPQENAGEPEKPGQPESSRADPGADPASVVLTPEQVARALGGTIIATYATAGQPEPVRYGARDAAAALARAGHRVAMRSGVYYVDDAPVTPEALTRLASGLRRDGRGSAQPGP